ncbi:Uncharacterized protein AC504_3871 [Pseudomonas syringae pv. maculicola]|uniref:Condensation domain-containing protein n=1 Tax=Pseudomonas savastanoi pv. glycinea TaxID=318 RepID=A0A3M3G274_PSESG|nr:hypothetical protein [Pseudomonas savastanoi]KPB86326.1 Uncharacterized protein AC504_3871 [Pseudomonas syringae pv. maculicola]MBN4178232.1 hypothetical protein [Pseudomonas savastanoi pv. phaseolicola]RMM68343.1 hypothetical protein ALQ73_102485 [Pseudomonas savastanoi pv. glycinea]RMR92353.1 hypothetical protein ALP76_01812 [Pseudomonas savastanoi pv. glycinea]
MEILRALSDVEAAFHYLLEMGNGSTQVVTALRLKGNFDGAILSARLASWAARHEVLNVTVHTTHTDSEQEELLLIRKPFQPEQLIISHEQQWFDHQAFFCKEINTPLRSGWPWRLSVILVRGALYLYFTRSHVFSDAFSTREVLRSLLEILLWNVSTEKLSTLIPNRVGQPLKQLKTAPLTVATQAHNAATTALRHCSISTIAERQTRIHRRVLDQKLSASIIAVCKARNITLNECFAAALAEAYANCLGTRQVELYTAINSRRHFSDALTNGLGCNIHVLSCSLQIMPLPLDSQALLYRSSLLQAGMGWAPSSLPHKALKSKVSQLCAAEHFLGPCITNSGINDFTSAIDRQVDFIETAVNRNVANYSVVLHVSCFRGRLQLLYSYASPAMSDALVKEIDYELMTRLGLLEASLSGQHSLLSVAL